MIKDYLNYLYKCYQADNNESGMLNFFAAKYEHQSLVKPVEELTNNQYPLQFVKDSIAKSIQQTLTLYSNDKELWYATLFCTGKRKDFRKRTQVLQAPLFLYKAQLVNREDDHFIKIDHDSRCLNIAFCKTLEFRSSFDDFYIAIDQLLAQHRYIDFEFISALKPLLKKHVHNIAFNEDLLVFPRLKNQTFLKNYAKNTSNFDTYTLHPAAGFCVISKVVNTNAIVRELEQLKENDNYSEGLKAFFSDQKQHLGTLNRSIHIPLLLNKAQERVVKNASSYNKSIIFGPPGTGKSYTIHAIAQDYITQGKTVLIATKTAQALEVLSGKLMKSKLGNFSIKVGGNYYKRSLIAKINRIFSGKYYDHEHLEKARDTRNTAQLLQKELTSVAKAFEKKTAKEIDSAEALLSEFYFKRVSSKLHINTLRKFEKEEWSLITKYFNLLEQYEKAANEALYRKLISSINTYADSELKKLGIIRNVLQTEEKSEINRALQNLDALPLTHFLPIWLVKIDEISRCLPLQKDLFDIAIIDEATQCDMASCLPIFQRAKKIVVAGDTNQLRHLSFLSKTQMQQFQAQYSIGEPQAFDFRRKSLLDFCLERTEKGSQTVLLDEHYRSLPDIIRFSNEQFYGKSLRIMTETPSKLQKNATELHFLTSVSPGPVNTAEVDAIIVVLKKLIAKEKELPKNTSSSIGVLSPFRQQTNALSKAIKETFELNTLKKHQIKLGTPYHFQGEERDIMLLSMGVSPHSHHGSINYLNKEDVFNVAITRAKNHQYVFHSITAKELPEHSLLRAYLDSFTTVKGTPKTSHTSEDVFSGLVQKFLATYDLNIYEGYDIAGLSIDLLLEREGKYLAVDLIGYPGSYTAAFNLERYRILHRMAIPVIPISYLSWTYQEETVKEFLNQTVLTILKLPITKNPNTQNLKCS